MPCLLSPRFLNHAKRPIARSRVRRARLRDGPLALGDEAPPRLGAPKSCTLTPEAVNSLPPSPIPRLARRAAGGLTAYALAASCRSGLALC